MPNFGLLKLELMRNGVFIPADALAVREISRGFAPGKRDARVAFALREDFFVKTFVTDRETGRAAIRAEKDGVLLQNGGDFLPVEVMPLPQFLQKLLRERDPVANNVALDGNCLNLFLRVVRKTSRLNIAEENLLAVIQAAFEEGVADLVQLNMDYCEEDDRGFSRLLPLIRDIRKKFSTFVSLRGFPPADKTAIDAVYAAGIDLLNYPLEGFAREESPEAKIPAPRIIEALRYAVEIFPQGAVATELVLGLESAEEMRDRIGSLTERGIIPHIKLPPLAGTEEECRAQTVEAARCLALAAQRGRLNLKWLYPTCCFLTPLDAAFFTEDAATAKLAARPVYQSTLGKKASEGFAALRRKLRVRDINDSFESAGL